MFILVIAVGGLTASEPGSEAEPVRYAGSESSNTGYHDGRLRPAVGVQNYEVMHSNRSHPEWSDGYGWTYNHAPMLAYWGGKFYVEYLSNPVGEHYPPGQTYVCTSTDGINWSFPEVVFPPYNLPGEGDILMHQRMGFYVAPNGRLLVLGFYGIPTGPSDSPNTGNGVGRVVREIYTDESFGPIYFIRYNAHCGYDANNTDYPYYTSSDDQGFKDACNALLANKLMTQQWWEEDRSTDGFYTLAASGGFSCKALSFWHRADGNAVGIWKEAWAALTSDEGQSWSTPVQCPTIADSTSKHWGQRTDDGRYALLYNPQRGPRWPLIVTTGDDGIIFDEMVVVHGEVAPRRRAGRYKDAGAQYVRGVCEGNGNPPGDGLWVTYSYNKEDIWVSRIPVPIRREVNEPVSDNFDNMIAGGVVTNWNIYSSKWAPAAVAESDGGKCLRLQDESPYDYAKAVRVFPESSEATLSFKVRPHQTSAGQLGVEVLDKSGQRPVQVEFDNAGRIMAQDGDSAVEVGAYQADNWYAITVSVDSSTQTYDLVVETNEVLANAEFAEPVASVERLEFRSGEYRLTDPLPGAPGSDLPNPDDPVALAVFDIDEVVTEDHVLYEPCEPESVVEITYVSTGRPYALGVAAVGELHYIDRGYFITEISTQLNNQEMIRTSNEDDYVSTEDHLRFTISRAATVYVVYDSRAEGNIPGWMSDWALTGEQVVTTDLYPDPLPYNVYSKSFAAGEVTLGGNDRTATGGRANYFVIVRPYPAVADFIVVDDMESYNNTDNYILETWMDGTSNWTSAILGLGIVPNEPVYGGEQSMIYAYYNNIDFGAGYYSEIEREYADPCDWTALGVKALTLYFYGDPNNDADDTEQMYVGLEDSNDNYVEVRYGDGEDEDMNDIKLTEWQEWNVDLQDFNDGGVALADVNKVYIGFGDRDNPVLPGGSGVVHFDDIRLYPPRCIPEYGPVGDVSGDCVVSLEDLERITSEWLDDTDVTADFYPDNRVDFKDYAILADNWLSEQLWPE